MEAMDLNAWWEMFHAASRDTWMDQMEQVEDDTCGFGTLLKQIWKDSVQKRPAGMYLVGPSGSGKHNSAAYFTDYLEQEQKFETLYVSGPELWPQNDSFEAVSAKLNYILDYYYDANKQALCLILDQWEEYHEQTKLLHFLERTLREYRRGAFLQGDDQYPPLFLILISEAEQKIPSLLRRMLRVCQLSLPDQLHRRLFFRQHEADINVEYISVDSLTELTEHCTYTQLTDLIYQLRLLEMQIDDIGIGADVDVKKYTKAFVQGLLPQPDDEAYRRRFFQKAEELMDALPTLLENKAKDASMYVSAQNNFTDHLADSRNELEIKASGQPTEDELCSMRVKELVSITFSKENLEQLL